MAWESSTLTGSDLTIGRNSESNCSVAGTARKTYCGYAPEPVPWAALDAIFVALFGEEGRALKKSPHVIGGTWARWTDAADVEYDATQLDEVREAYEAALTACIFFSRFSEVDFRYTPGSHPPYACLSLSVSGAPEEVATPIEVMRGAFPL